MPDHKQKARELWDGPIEASEHREDSIQILAAALAEVEREAAKKCAEMVDCESTRNRIRRKFGVEE